MDIARLCAAQNHLQSWFLRRERLWRQKAWSYGFNMIDHNNKFIHASTVIRRKKNEIVQLEINRRTVHGVSNLKREISFYFADRFSQEHNRALDFDMGHHLKKSADQVRFLESRPTRDEVKNAVWACGTDKAPGFDGYNFKFIREMWDVINEQIYEFVLDFLDFSGSAKAINVTWVTLIPKIMDPCSIEDYRQISIMGTLYKVMSKLLSLRLKQVIASLIDESHNAFVMDRQILGVLVTNEAIRWLKKKRIHGALLKLDF
ncbi:uncharacterized protein LOC130801116 [Amaranthus tricolor]|uniref:uncharacterized protein LOC130801116 n=1 Tax=Amaranthus tricolor TaxID=29722 RepID=UPI00258775EF|nr:uncharacterized protein LOC130801116 [Amaranthus tricolor]